MPLAGVACQPCLEGGRQMRTRAFFVAVIFLTAFLLGLYVGLARNSWERRAWAEEKRIMAAEIEGWRELLKEEK